MVGGHRPLGVAWDVVPWAAVALTVAAGLWRPAALTAVQLYPWLISIVVFGLPHGACDHLVLPRLWRRRWRARDWLAFYALYLAACALVVALWLVNPLAGLLYFLAITVWHWGSADAAAEGYGPFRFIARSLTRGAIVVLAPVAFHPHESVAAFAGLLALVEPTVRATTLSVLLPRVAAGLIALAVALDISTLVWSAWRGDIRQAARGVVDVALLLLLFAVVNPLAAVGVYFVAWHAWRHVLRVGALLDGEAGRVGWWRTVALYYRRAWPLTLVSIAGLIGVTVAFGWANPPRLVSVYLVLLSALTLPHATVVALWDYRARRASLPRAESRRPSQRVEAYTR